MPVDVTAAISPSLDDIHKAALGYQSWNINPNLGSGNTAPTAGTIYVASFPLKAGQPVSNILWQIGVAGSGTVPTDIFVGLASSAGVMLTQSATLKASGIWTQTTNIAAAPVTAYVAPTNDLYYGVFLQVGSWSVTQLTLGKGVNNSAPAALGGAKAFGTAGTSQTALPVNGQSLTIVVTNGISYITGAS